VGCYIWHIKEGPGWAEAPPSPLRTVPNVTVHLSMYRLHIIRCGTIIANAY